MKVGGFEFKRRKLTSARPFGEQPRVCKGERLEAQAAKGVFGRVYACRICKFWFCGRKKNGYFLTVSVGNAALERSIRVYRVLRLYDNRSASVLQDWQGCVLSHILASWYYSAEKKIDGCLL